MKKQNRKAPSPAATLLAGAMALPPPASMRLFTVANELRLLEGGEAVAGRLLHVAAAMLALSGNRHSRLNEHFRNGFRNFELEDLLR